MKDKAILIISILLVVAGVLYLGFTAYRFFTNQEVEEEQQEQVVGSESLALQGASNKEILAENINQGESVSLSISLNNESSENSAQAEFEGRVYSVDEMFEFPNIDSDVPVTSEEIEVNLDPGQTNEFTYEPTINECGNMYVAVAEEDYWENGRGIIAYGYANVNCDGQNGFTSPTDVEREQSPLQRDEIPADEQEGAENGEVAGTDDKPNELPKAGPEENIVLVGILFVVIGFGYLRRLDTLV